MLLEVGCGVGNALFPLLEDFHFLHVHGVDCSARAISLVQRNPLYDPSRSQLAVCDISKQDVPLSAFTKPDNSFGVDVATLIFVLSAIHPDNMQDTLKRIFRCLLPGGMLYLRDYALYVLA